MNNKTDNLDEAFIAACCMSFIASVLIGIGCWGLGVPVRESIGIAAVITVMIDAWVFLSL